MLPASHSTGTWPCGEMIGRSLTCWYRRRARSRTAGSAGRSRSSCGCRPGSSGMTLMLGPTSGRSPQVATSCREPLPVVTTGGHSVRVSSTDVSATTTLPEPVVLPASTVGDASGVLSPEEVTAFVREQLDAYPVDGRSVCILVPDGTRTCPLPLLLKAVHASLAGRASRMTALVALGTHAAMSDEALATHLGYAD